MGAWRRLLGVGLVCVLGTGIAGPDAQAFEIPGAQAPYTEILATSADGRYVAVSYSSDTLGNRVDWVDTVAGARVDLHTSRNGFAELSGDGLHALTTDGTGYVWRDLSNGRTASPDPSVVGSVAFSPAGSRSTRLMTTDGALNIVNTSSGGFLFDASTGTSEQLVPAGSTLASISADGRFALLLEWDCPLPYSCARAVLLDRATGTRSVLGSYRFDDPGDDIVPFTLSADGRYVFEWRGPMTTADATGAATTHLVRSDRTTGAQTVLGTLDELRLGLQVSDDGTLVTALVDGQVIAIDASTARRRATGIVRSQPGGTDVPMVTGDATAVLNVVVTRIDDPVLGVRLRTDVVAAPLYHRLAPDVPLALQIAGTGGVPLDAAAVALNVTAVDAGGPGFVTVWPCGNSVPVASNLNYDAGQIVPNAVVARLGPGGEVCIVSHAPVDLVVDVQGYFPNGSSVEATTPARMLDTRVAIGTDSTQPAAAGASQRVQIAGRAGVPGDAGVVAVNLTVTEPQAAGYVTLYPCGDAAPLASTLNYAPGQTRANAALVRLDATGGICLTSKATAHLVLDVNGFVTAGGPVVGIEPTRVIDTRETSASRPAGMVGAGSTLEVHVAAADIPRDASAAVVNVTITAPTGPGFATAYPCDGTLPLASNLNFVTGETVANLALARPDANGNMCVFVSAAAHVVVDVAATISGNGAYVGLAPTRVLDTRFA